jgi:bifunctional non-homologous end joining protein LigD
VLPHVVNRPLALVRCPSGAEKGCFFQKHAWAGLPDVILRDMVRDEEGEEEVLYVENLQGLIALVQASVLEIHPWGAPIDDVERPDRIVMDFDPGEGVGWPQVIDGAREARERLKAMGLTSFVKTTGGKGLHVVLPLQPKAGWDEVKTFARELAEAMERDSPAKYVSTSVKKARHGKIYVDYLRNGRGATAISAYSTRARPGAPIAVPLTWEELSPAIKPNRFTVANLPARLNRLRKDPWQELFKIKQTLPAKSSRSVARKPSRRAA